MFNKHFACMSNERNPTAVVGISSVLFVEGRNDRIVLLLGDFCRYDKDGV